jgi:hypothetical protein
MAAIHEDVWKALSMLENLQLPHPCGAILSSYIKEAMNPIIAARYVMNRLNADEAPTLMSDWIYILESSMEFPPLKYDGRRI